MLEDIKNRYKKVYIYSQGIYNNQELKKIFEPLEWRKVSLEDTLSQDGFLIVWGRKPNTIIPVKKAQLAGIKVLYLEDGFIRSYGLGKTGAVTKSIVVDDIGIYYDATKPSRLENLCNQNSVTPKEKEESKRLIKKITENNISKYNNSNSLSKKVKKELSSEKSKVLIIGQVDGDMSLQYGMAKYTYEKIIKIAKKENPQSEIYYKIHPDLLLSGKYKEIKNVKLIKENWNPVELLKYFDKVYTKTSQMGFEALMLKKEVVCFGMPFYAGWGLTDDRVKNIRRTTVLDLESLFYNAYIKYPIYLNNSIEKTIDELIEAKKNEKSLIVYGVSNWKRHYFQNYFKEGEEVTYLEENQEFNLYNMNFKENKEIIIWGKKENEHLQRYAEAENVQIIRVEDGFLRSISLGVQKSTPGSLCFDKTGIYYDAQKPSDLENLLNSFECSDELLIKSKKIRKIIVENKLSKYNNSKHINFEEKFGIKTKHRVLVVGQVEGDMSLKYGCEKLSKNNDLVRLAKEENPDSEIFYKIHPDSLKLGLDDHPEEVQDICTIINENMSIDSVLESMDKVYTMTSLMGMEALIRDKDVTCIGAPFYSGWGLTDDKQKVNRRNRIRTIDELFAIVYLVYPVYFDVHNKKICDIELTIENLIKDYESIIINEESDKTLNKNNYMISDIQRTRGFFMRTWRKARKKVLVTIGVIK